MSPKIMKALCFERYGNHSVDELKDIPAPSEEDLKAGEVLLKMHSASLNPVDWKQRGGEIDAVLIRNRKWPQIHGFDFCGEVIAAKETQKLKKGDMVFGMIPAVRKGTVAEFFVTHESVCAKAPDEVTSDELASVPLVGITSILAFRSAGYVETPGKQDNIKVLVLGGAGGVGSCAIQLARGLYGASFVSCTASERNQDFVRTLGVDEVIDYKADPDFTSVEDNTFDFVFHTVGKLNLPAVRRITKPGGCVTSIDTTPSGEGVAEWLSDVGTEDVWPGVAPFILSGVGKSIINLFLGAKITRWRLSGKEIRFETVIGRGNGELMSILKGEIEAKRLKGVVGKVFPLSEAKEAMKYLESGKASGKVVIQCSKQG